MIETDGLLEPTKFDRHVEGLHDKINKPTEWLERRAEQIDKDILAFNEAAEKNGVNPIVAFRMTTEERDEFLESLGLLEPTNEQEEIDGFVTDC